MRIMPILPGTQPELADVEAQIVAARGKVSLLYQVLLNSPAIAGGWEQLLSAIRLKSGVPASLRELVILRVAILNGAPYEFEAHEPLARGAGVSERLIESVRDGGDLKDANSLERLVIELTDAMTRDIIVSDSLFGAIAGHFNDQTLTELIATIASYNMVSRFLVALRVGH